MRVRKIRSYPEILDQYIEVFVKKFELFLRLVCQSNTKDAKIMPKGLRRPKKATIIAVKP